MRLKYVLISVLLSCISFSFIQEDLPQSGTASYYSDKLHGRKTASGAIYNKNLFTAAHRTLPFGTLLEVTNTRNNQSVIVVVNDRGPYTKDRLIDVSKAAAKELGMLQSGICDVKINYISVQIPDSLLTGIRLETDTLILDSLQNESNWCY